MKKQEKKNLWNLSKDKTTETISYIENLEFPTDNSEWKKFKYLQEKALKSISANKMLACIGFNPLGIDKIYKWCSNEKKRV